MLKIVMTAFGRKRIKSSKPALDASDYTNRIIINNVFI